MQLTCSILVRLSLVNKGLKSRHAGSIVWGGGLSFLLNMATSSLHRTVHIVPCSQIFEQDVQLAITVGLHLHDLPGLAVNKDGLS